MKCCGSKVPVAEGQRLQMAFDVPPIDVENPNDLKEDLGRRISWNVMGPTFYPLSTNALKDDTYFHDDNVEAIKDKTTTGTMTTQPIRWNNINSSDLDVYGGFVSGEQYVALRYSTLSARQIKIRNRFRLSSASRSLPLVRRKRLRR